MQNKHVDDLVDAYALGALESEEVDAVERHLESCEACRALVTQARETAERLLYAAPPVIPPASLRARVLQRVREEAAAQPHASALPAAPGQHDARSPTTAPARRGGVRHLLRALFGEQPALEHEAGDLLRDLLADPQCTVQQVAGTGDAPGASARLVAVPARRDAVLVASGLRQPGPGKAYQVWLLSGGKPLPNTLFTVNRSGRGAAVVHADGPWQGFDTVAVTPEPERGSPGPTGPIVLAAALAR